MTARSYILGALLLVGCFDSDELVDVAPAPDEADLERQEDREPPPDMPGEGPVGLACIEASTGVCSVVELDECPAEHHPACEFSEGWCIDPASLLCEKLGECPAGWIEAC